MQIYIVRHGQTDYNLNGIVQGGGIDSKLNEKGRSQAAMFYEQYGHIPFDHIYVSGLKRTRQTVQAFIESGIPSTMDDDINEMNWGVFEGKPYDSEMKGAYLDLISEWDKGNLDERIEGGESGSELSLRLNRFLNRIVMDQHNTILVCTHGRTIRALITLIQGLHLRNMEKVQHSNTGLYRVFYDELSGYRILDYNNLDHLKVAT